MELNQIIQIVEQKAVEIAEQEILKYQNEFPELNLTDEAKDAVKVRSTSQLCIVWWICLPYCSSACTGFSIPGSCFPSASPHF